MKKFLVGAMTFIVLIALIMPVTLYADVSLSHNLKASEMKVGGIVEVTVKLDYESEAIQFDLAYDSNVFEYVQNSSNSDLDISGSNPYIDGIVRTFSLDTHGNKTDTVTLKFRALSEATNSTFTLVNLETDRGIENVSSAKVTVNKITSDGKNKGDKKKKLPNTGVTDIVATQKSIAGKYASIPVGTSGETIRNAVPYALPDSDDTLTVDDVKAEFPTARVPGLSNPVKTGDKFYEDLPAGSTTEYTIIIYGDTNSDGRVSVYDGLMISNHIRGLSGATLTGACLEAADVQNDGIINNDDIEESLERFVLKTQHKNPENITGTVITRYPSEYKNINVTTLTDKTFRYDDENIKIAKVTSDQALTTDMVGGKITSGPTGAEVRAFVDAGEVYVGLYAPKAGTYKFKPYITGNKVEGKTKYGDEITVTVEDVYTVSEVKMTNLGTTLSMGMDTSETATLEYYHNYVDKSGDLIKQEKIDYANIGTVKVNRGTEQHISVLTLKNEDGNTATAGTGLTAPKTLDVSAYKYHGVQGATVGTETLTVNVTNDTKYSTALGYAADQRAKEISITVNTKEIASIEFESSNLDLWMESAVDYDFPVIQDASEGYYYTVLKINSVKDNKGNDVPLYNSEVNVSSDVLKVYENGVTAELAELYGLTEGETVDIEYKGFIVDSDNVTPASGNNTIINAIGFACNTLLDDLDLTDEDNVEILIDVIDRVEQGIKILNSKGTTIFEFNSVSLIVPDEAIPSGTYSTEPTSSEESTDTSADGKGSSDTSANNEDNGGDSDNQNGGDETSGGDDPNGEGNPGNTQPEEVDPNSQTEGESENPNPEDE